MITIVAELARYMRVPSSLPGGHRITAVTKEGASVVPRRPREGRAAAQRDQVERVSLSLAITR